MAKRGSEYEEIVGAVCRALDPAATVDVGTWIVGPDGRRDMDVAVRGTRDGRALFALIECKDWKYPVGVAVVDALDSKRHDLGADVATIYSNSGFTGDAERKATRVGISLCSAMKADDPRVRVRLERDFYAKTISVDSWSLSTFWRRDRAAFAGPDPRKLNYRGRPLVNWLSKKSNELVIEHWDRSYIRAEYAFREELEFEYDGNAVHLVGLIAHLHCSNGWARQTIHEDVSLGSYDFLGRKLTIPNNQLWGIGPFVNDAWKPVESAPAESQMEENSIMLSMTIVKPIGPMGDMEAPQLDEHILEHAITFDAPAV